MDEGGLLIYYCIVPCLAHLSKCSVASLEIGKRERETRPLSETYKLNWLMASGKQRKLNSGCLLLQRLQELYLLDPATYSTLTGIVEKEVKEGTARKVDSCARAILWLAR
jgi:hypothetical protein